MLDSLLIPSKFICCCCCWRTNRIKAQNIKFLQEIFDLRVEFEEFEEVATKSWGFHLRLRRLLSLLLLLAVDVVAPDPVQAETRCTPVFVAPLRLPVVRTGESQLLRYWGMRWGFGIRDDARIKVTRCWGQGCDLINQMWGWFYPPVFRGRTHSCPGSHRSQTFQSSDRGLICTWVGVHIYMCVPKKENRNIGFCKCRMETNKQTANRELICTWVGVL